jgi:hypothetical protein
VHLVAMLTVAVVLAVHNSGAVIITYRALYNTGLDYLLAYLELVAQRLFTVVKKVTAFQDLQETAVFN